MIALYLTNSKAKNAGAKALKMMINRYRNYV